MADAPNLGKLVPGFDFLQGLVKNAGAALPSIGQWVAPTLDPQELEKRISELKTVQFWLEQNARMLGATIQALEVQRMTLSTLKTMNVQMSDLRDSLQIRMPNLAKGDSDAAAPSAARSGPDAESASASEGADASDERSSAPGAANAKRPAEASATPAPGAVDPLQWWGALTKQFSQLAATAMQESAGDAAARAAGQAPKPSIDRGAGVPSPSAAGAAKPKRAAAKNAARKRAAP
jgi:hypothetical protein